MKREKPTDWFHLQSAKGPHSEPRLRGSLLQGYCTASWLSAVSFSIIVRSLKSH